MAKKSPNTVPDSVSIEKTLQGLIEFQKELNGLISDGKNLREVSQYTFEQRQAGRNVPYFYIGNTISVEGKREKVVTYIFASPIASQKELKAFFDLHTTESVFNDYTMYADLEDGPGLVVIKKRLGRGTSELIPADFCKVIY